MLEVLGGLCCRLRLVMVLLVLGLVSLRLVAVLYRRVVKRAELLLTEGSRREERGNILKVVLGLQCCISVVGFVRCSQFDARCALLRRLVIG